MGMPLDKVVDKIVGLGVPGLVLVVAISVSGLAGGAAIVAALAALGGPFGMLGGIALLGIILLISRAITQYGFEAIVIGVVKGLKDKGVTKDEIIATVNRYWFISHDLKARIIHSLDVGD